MMTKPVAYRFRESNQTYSFIDSRFIGANPLQGQPLYTAEQLQQRVKMTQAEFDEFKDLHYRHVIASSALVALDRDYSSEKYLYLNLYNKMYTIIDTQQMRKNEEMFTKLFADFDPERPEETIEIVPNKKWFVISKDLDDGIYYVMGAIDERYPTFNSALDELDVAKFGHEFDTKEQAEEWTNPLTEAVLLPVEDE